VQWVLWCEEFVVKSGVHATDNSSCAPQFASFKLRCYQHLWVLSLKIANLGAHTQIILLKYPLFWASVHPLCKYTVMYGAYGRFWPTLSGQPISGQPIWPTHLANPSGQPISGQPYLANPIWPTLSGQPYLANPIWPTLSGQPIHGRFWPTLDTTHSSIQHPCAALLPNISIHIPYTIYHILSAPHL